MPTTTHAPGPWIVGRDQDGNLLIESPDSAEQGIVATVNRARGGLRPDGEANARLIAAAPELLAALRVTVNLLDNEGMAADKFKALLARIDGPNGDNQ
jgi:hypothetical protein